MKSYIFLDRICFFAHHGVGEQETLAGNEFTVSLRLQVNIAHAMQTDDVADTVSYADVYEVVKEIVENKRFNLLEALAENIAEEVLNKFDLLKGIMVRVKKPEAPVPGIYDYFGVEIKRAKDE